MRSKVIEEPSSIQSAAAEVLGTLTDLNINNLQRLHETPEEGHQRRHGTNLQTWQQRGRLDYQMDGLAYSLLPCFFNLRHRLIFDQNRLRGWIELFPEPNSGLLF